MTKLPLTHPSPLGGEGKVASTRNRGEGVGIWRFLPAGRQG